MKYNQRFNEQRALRFHHFTRKGWALFACLGRVVTISVLSVATLESASAATTDITTKRPHPASPAGEELTDVATAEDDLIEKVDSLAGIEVTGSLAPLTTGQGVRVVTVLTRDEIQAAPVQSVNDLLKLVTGVDVRQRGPIGAQTDVGIRGGTQEQITILLNGINICDPQTGHNTMDLPCNVADIVRIEVLEGPASRVYGTQSLMGAINIVTSLPTAAAQGQQDHVQLALEGGSFGYLSAAASVSLSSPRGGREGVSASYTRSDGYSRSKGGRLNSDYSGVKAFYQGSSQAGDVRLNWHAGISDRGWGSNTFYSAKFDEQYEKTTKLYTALQGDFRWLMEEGRRKKGEGAERELHLKPALYWNHSRDRFELIRGSEAKVPFNHHRTNVVGLNVNGWFDWLLGRTALGAEFRNEDIVSTNLGEPLDKPFGHYKVGLNRSQLSFHAEHNIMLRQLTLSAGFIAIRNTGNEMDFKVYPGIDASLRLNSHWKLFASYNESLRMPTFTELYYSVGGHKADKYLKPEELRAVEGGVRFEHGAWSVEGKTFYHHCRNIIDWVMDTRDADPVWQSVNLTKVNTLGQELAVNCRLSAVNWQIAYTHLHQHKDEQPHLQSQYSLEYLRHKLAARLNWQLSRHLSTTLCYRYQDRTGSYTSTDGQVKDYRPYSVVDARVAWKMTTTELYAEVNNLTSTHYIDYGNVAQPGCWVTVGCKKTLNYK